MKKFLFALALAFTAGASAQTLLDETFETGNTGDALRPVGLAAWTTVDTYAGDNADYTWHNYYHNPGNDGEPTIDGLCCAAVSAPVTTPDDGSGPREEALLTPELNLDDTYQLRFSFRVSPMAAYDNSRYDLQVRVLAEGESVTQGETVFSIQNEQMLRESGVTVYPIGDWNVYSPKIDLSAWKGEKVRLAFVYKVLKPIANVVWLDNVSVRQFTPATTPVAQLSMDRYDFGQMYVGERHYSEVMTLTNVGKDGLRLTGADLPAGVTLNASDDINLRSYQSAPLQFLYTASLTSATQGQAVLHTTGGDITVQLTAQKTFVPDGMTLETFEGYFPAAGWKATGWGPAPYALEGDQSAYADGAYTKTYLRSPRLDLSDGGQLIFTYYNRYDGEEAPEYDITLELSEDGGDTYRTLWTSDYQNGLNQVLTDTVDLGIASDDSYIRWVYPAVESDDEGAFEHSAFTLDRVLLPRVYGQGGVPLNCAVVEPVNNATGILPTDIVLRWTPAQFAQGYRLYVGTNAEANDLVDGLDLGQALTYTIPEAQFATTYRWRVVAYNEQGNSVTASTWRFTTQADATISAYPYEQTFNDGDALPEGWVGTPSETYARQWSPNTYYPYTFDGKSYAALASGWLNTGETNAVTTPAFQLPADASMALTFVWGDAHPSDLLVDPTGMHTKTNVEPNNGQSDCTLEILADGQWTRLAHLSEDYFDADNETKYWENERIDLAPYRGKTVKFRWTHYALSGGDDGTALAHIRVEEQAGDKASLNRSLWQAGKVNYEKAVNSGDIFTLANRGTAPLTVESATFTTPNFQTSVEAGTVLAPDSALTFNVQFNALDAAREISDTLVVRFTSGYTTQLPVAGEALPQGIYYYSFEPNPLELQWTDDFTLIDVDNSRGYSFASSWVNYSKDGQKSSFSCEDDSNETGMYGMMAPVSGNHALVAASPQESCADNWIVARGRVATASSTFSFFARNWEDLGSVEPDDPHCITVLVSTQSQTDRKTFEEVMPKTTLPYLNYKEWQEYEVDLSKYAGQLVYVALRHTTDQPTNLAFFDDFTLADFAEYDPSAIETVNGQQSTVNQPVYTLDGRLAGTSLTPLRRGIYVVGGRKVMK